MKIKTLQELPKNPIFPLYDFARNEISFYVDRKAYKASELTVAKLPEWLNKSIQGEIARSNMSYLNQKVHEIKTILQIR